MVGERKHGGEKCRRRNRAAKDPAATRSFWVPDLEIEARRLEAYLGRKLRGAALTVKVERGHLVVYDSGSRWTGSALAAQRQLRLTPINTGVYRLSYLRHSGRWWPLPYTGTIKELASTVAGRLAPPSFLTQGVPGVRGQQMRPSPAPGGYPRERARVRVPGTFVKYSGLLLYFGYSRSGQAGTRSRDGTGSRCWSQPYSTQDDEDTHDCP